MALLDKEKFDNIPEFIQKKFEEHNIKKIQLVQSICYAVCNRCFVNGYKKYYEIYDGVLIIEDSIYYDNVLEYYDFLNKEDKARHKQQYDIRMKSENKVA